MKPGSRVRILAGPDKGQEATIVGLTYETDDGRIAIALPDDVDPIIEFTPDGPVGALLDRIGKAA